MKNTLYPAIFYVNGRFQSLEGALEDFRRTRQETARSLETLQAEQQKLKQGRVSEIEKMLREGLRKGRPEST